jgi:hypothetical protein
MDGRGHGLAGNGARLRGMTVGGKTRSGQVGVIGKWLHLMIHLPLLTQLVAESGYCS